MQFLLNFIRTLSIQSMQITGVFQNVSRQVTAIGFRNKELYTSRNYDKTRGKKHVYAKKCFPKNI